MRSQPADREDLDHLRKVVRLGSAQVGSQRVAMTDIDPGAKFTIGHVYDVNQDRDKDHLVVYIPLAEHVDQEWIG